MPDKMIPSEFTLNTSRARQSSPRAAGIYALTSADAFRNCTPTGMGFSFLEAFCRSEARASLPATAETVAAFAAKSAETLKANTVERRLTAISPRRTSSPAIRIPSRTSWCEPSWPGSAG